MWHLLFVASATVVVCVSASSDCPCHGGLALAQTDGKPWKTFVPPAPNAPLTACGCGFQKVTSRRDLREMPPATVRKMVANLEKEVNDLQATLTKNEGEHKVEEAKLKARMDKMKESDKGGRDDNMGESKKRQATHQSLKGEVDGFQDDIATMNMELSDERATLRDINEALEYKMAAISRCDCTAKASALSTQTFLSHMKNPVPNKPNYDLIFKVEKLEAEKNKLDKDISNELEAYGTLQRSYLSRQDTLETKMNLEKSRSANYKSTDDSLTANLLHQKEASKKWQTNKDKQLQRVKVDVGTAQAKMDELDAEMQRCNCAL